MDSLQRRVAHEAGEIIVCPEQEDIHQPQSRPKPGLNDEKVPSSPVREQEDPGTCTKKSLQLPNQRQMLQATWSKSPD